MSDSGEQSSPSLCPVEQGDETAADTRSVSHNDTASGTESHPKANSGDDPEVVEWIAAAQNGDRNAFEWLILHYQDRVWRRALYRLRDADEAYDLAQEVFLTCFRKIHQFRGEAKFWTWLGRIVDNHVKNRLAWLTRRGKDKTFSLDAPRDPEDEGSSWDPPDESPGPRREVENREAMDILSANMDKLSPDHREILLLRFADGLAYEEISETLEVSIGTVKSRINRARSELRKLMKDFLEES